MASTYFDMTAADAGLKELYTDQAVAQLIYTDNPFLALIPKSTDFVGKVKPIPIIYGTSQGRSANFAKAQANQSAAEIEAFVITRTKDYSVATIDNETMEASARDKGAFVKGAKLSMDSAFQVITNSISSALFRSGTGSIGKINASGPSTGVITLTDPNDVVQFERNMTLTAHATDGAAARAAKGYVIAVDTMAGTITVAATGFDGAAADPSGWLANDFLCVEGDLNSKPKGLAAWLPKTAPASNDSFFGVNRSAHPTRLAGIRYDGSAQNIEEAIVDATMYCAREGATPETLVTNYVTYAALEKALGTKVQYCDLSGPAGVGFKGLKINGYKGTINVIPDRNCQAKTGYLLTMKHWKLEGLNDVPHIVRQDENTWLRVATADAAEVRIAAYYQVACEAPGRNAVVSFAA